VTNAVDPNNASQYNRLIGLPSRVLK